MLIGLITNLAYLCFIGEIVRQGSDSRASGCILYESRFGTHAFMSIYAKSIIRENLNDREGQSAYTYSSHQVGTSALYILI